MVIGQSVASVKLRTLAMVVLTPNPVPTWATIRHERSLEDKRRILSVLTQCYRDGITATQGVVDVPRLPETGVVKAPTLTARLGCHAGTLTEKYVKYK